METANDRSGTKAQLLAIAKGLRACDPAAIERAVDFFVAESRGHWHNRARAKFARRLKHCPLHPGQVDALVGAVCRRLETGDFTEQFADQLRLALHLDRAAILDAARAAAASPRPHVGRMAAWVLAHRGLDGIFAKPCAPPNDA